MFPGEMGQVVPFIARVRESGDWTAAERARLQELADRLGASGVDVEVIYGATDEGDPWCVVTDGDGDVLIHVARIGGAFVVHSAIDDAVNENVDLHAALRDRLDATDDVAAAYSATILPFALRQGQTFLALVVAAAFFYETAGVGETAQAAELPAAPLSEPEAPPPETDTQTPERDLATQGATLQSQATPAAAPVTVAAILPPPEPAAAAPVTHDEDAPTAPATSVEEPEAAAPVEVTTAAAAPTEAPVVIQGTDGDDEITGTAADEHIIGGAGNDTLRGGGGHDTLEGGVGDDRIELTSGTIAIGGEGADTFVIQSPVQMGHANTLLGVVLDFSNFDGDRLITANGRFIAVPPRPGEPGKPGGPITQGGETALTGDGAGGDRSGGGDFSGQGFDPTHPTLIGGGNGGTTLVVPPLTRVEVDVDGDGVIDGYVLVGRNGHILGGEENPIVLTPGHGLSDGSLLG